MTQASAGDIVHVHYTGRLEDGTVFDSSLEEGEPLEFEAGGDELFSGVSNAVIGMSVGEKKTVTLSPEEAYGDYQEGLTQTVPLAQLPEGVEVGDELSAETEDETGDEDETVTVWVTEVGEEKAVVDGNHPLAGKTLVFDLELQCIHPPGG